MNIKEFKEGAIITRNQPMVYKHNGSADGSYLGDKMKLLSVDFDAKMIFIQHLENWSDDDEPNVLSFARDPWDEGWAYYPQSVYEKAKSLMSRKSK
jgi:hypothetical protein